jgi:hypothetical protein
VALGHARDPPAAARGHAADRLLSVLAAPLLCALLAAEPGLSMPAVVAEADRLAAAPLWPGFDWPATPVAVFDGQRTWLFRHPHPPAAFVAEGAAHVFPGRHPDLTANTAVKLGGVLTAGVIADLTTKPEPRALAGVLIHEAFHAFQVQRHPDWTANEADLFNYPSDDAAVLGLRRLETAALLRALGREGGDEGRAWARAALLARRERFARMAREAVAYERGSELKEGLAQYVEDSATGRAPRSRWPEGEFPPDGIRWRAYASGQALAVLLDRLDPAWKAALEARGGTLDGLLEAALGPGPAAGAAADRQAAAERAERDAAAFREGREAKRKAFLDAAGARLELVAAPGAPLFPQGFDPLNVLRLPDRAVLHTRFLKLGNQAGMIEVFGRASLTEPAGEHPLFGGVTRLVVTGLAAPPKVEERGATVAVEGEGIKAELRGARVVRGPGTIRIELGAPAPPSPSVP